MRLLMRGLVLTLATLLGCRADMPLTVCPLRLITSHPVSHIVTTQAEDFGGDELRTECSHFISISVYYAPSITGIFFGN
jgi:hypothetical protein